MVFLLLSNAGAEKIRKKLKLNVDFDPAFDPGGPGKTVIICMTENFELYRTGGMSLLGFKTLNCHNTYVANICFVV